MSRIIGVLKKLWPVIVLAVLAVLYFYKILFLKKIFLMGDLYYYYSLRVFIAEAIKSFQFPLWTPYLTCGFPLMANPEAGTFDPLNLILLYFFYPATAFNLLICSYFFMAGFFTFKYCRSIGLDICPSLLSGFVFIFGGAFAGRLVHISMIFSASFMPLVFWTISLFFKEKKLKFIFLAGLGMGLTFIPGHPQIAVYVCFSGILYFLFNAFSEIKKDHTRNNIFYYIIAFLAILIVGFGISAIQTIPTKELAVLTGRGQMFTFKDAKTISLDFWHLITYIFPYFFGFDSSANMINYWGKGSFWELYLYIGIVPFCLLIAAFNRIRDKRILFFSGLAILSLFFALGKKTPIYPIFFYLLPPLRYFKDPCRFIFILSFASAILAGLGLNYLASEEGLRKRIIKPVLFMSGIIFTAVLILNLLGGTGKKILSGINLGNPYTWLPFGFFLCMASSMILFNKKIIKKSLFNLLICAVTLIDLFIVGYTHNIPEDRSLLTTAPASVNFLKEDKGSFRVFHIGPDFPYGAKSHVEIDKAPFFTLWGISSANFAGPLRMRAYNSVFCDINDINLFKQGSEDFNIDGYLERFGLFNVKYFTSTVKLKSDNARLVFQDKAITIYENTKATPRIFFVKYPIMPERDMTELNLTPPAAGANDYCRIKAVDYANNRVHIDINTGADGFLVVSDTYYPGWEVFVDDRKAKINKANTIMRAVYLKTGRHKVKFIYNPVSFKWGLFLSFISLIIVFSAFFSRNRDSIPAASSKF